MTIHVGIDGITWRNERGFGRFTRELVEAFALRDTGFRYTLVLDTPPDAAFPVPDGVETVVVGQGTEPARRLAMSQASSKLGCDVFYFPTVYSFYPMLSRVPKVVQIHDTIPERFPDLIFPTKFNERLWHAKTWLAKWQATRVLAGSESSVRDMTEILGIPHDRVDLNTMAAASHFRQIDDPDAIAGIRARFNMAETAKILVYLGGFNRHKNVIRLIEAMPEILSANSDAHLLIVGRTTGERFWDNIEDLKSTARDSAAGSDRIQFTGEISDEDLALLLNAAHALVHPALYEGFGFPPVEAMACGTPPVASNASSIPEVVGDAGLLFDPTDAGDIAEKVTRMLNDDALYAELAAKAPHQAAKFTWDRAAAMSEASFRKALGQAG